MKMPKNTACCIKFSRQRNVERERSLRLQWRTFAADIMAVRLQKQSTQRCAPLSPSSFVTFSRLRRTK